ncbi:hypothetical protein T8J41_11970 [Nitratireductor rhodophyticola]|uniref:hypothetical protein n=1 Tax=Nitratireductor rhodophyticola TaxID=2854036 RepID=UPI002AC99367|nr:hypothetical protein [Nitratireductor rhodophyticola]WPZ12895.1 hypothetical protein T8J41_11970 [Nitratireductor rhodophyticola]
MAKSGVPHKSAGIYDAEEMAAMENAIEAVCTELGIGQSDSKSRERVAGHVMRSWASGRRLPLNLVQAGLDSVARLEA